jgi:hypothetical protein
MGKKKYETAPARKSLTILGAQEDIDLIDNYFSNHPDVVRGFEYTKFIVQSIKGIDNDRRD